MRSPSSETLSNNCTAPPGTAAEESQPAPTTLANGNDHDLAISEQDLVALGLGSLVQDSGNSSGGELNLAHLLSDVDRAEHLLDHLDARVDSILKSLDELAETTGVSPTKQ
ncbi:hypothetical protein H4R35_000265 [Dimargaris xerosporica]|nr:hypothetical protein H4R35_000265 [Dimargaris xerosporica]